MTNTFEILEMNDEIEQEAEQNVGAPGTEGRLNDYNWGKAASDIKVSDNGFSINNTKERYVVGKEPDDGFFGMALCGEASKARMPGGWSSSLSADAFVLGRTNRG